MKHMLQGVNVKVFVALVADEIMPVPFMVAHEEILAVGRLDVLPVRQAVLDGEYCRVIVDFIGYSMVIQPGECSLYFF